MSDAGIGAAKRGLRPLTLAAIAGLLLFAASASLAPVRAIDTWVHLTTGRVILQERAVPTVDRYSFTATGNRFVAHEWLADLFYAAAETAAGIPGVIVLGKLLPALALTGGLVAAAWAWGARTSLALPVCLLALVVARTRIVARPELLVWVLIVAAVWILVRDRTLRRLGQRTRVAFWLVPLAALWANLHASFPVAFLLVLTFAAAELADDLLGARDRRAAVTRTLGVLVGLAGAAWLAILEPAAFGRSAAAAVALVAALFAADGLWPIFLDPARAPAPPGLAGPGWLLAIAAAMGLAVAANPVGAAIYAFPFEFTAGVNAVTTQVLEWRPLLDAGPARGSPPVLSFLTFAALWLAVLSLGVWRGRLGRLEVALWLVIGLLALRHVRWVVLVAVATTPALAAALTNTLGRARPASLGRRLVATALAACALAVLAAAAKVYSGIWMSSSSTWIWSIGLASGFGALLLATRKWPARVRAAATMLTAAAAIGLAMLTSGVALRSDAPAWSEPRGPSARAAGAVEFLRSHEIGGRLFTEYEWAPFAIHQLWPRVTVFIDGRSEVYGDELLQTYVRIKRDPLAAAGALDAHAVDLLLVRFPAHPDDPGETNPGVLGAVADAPDWVPLYLDDHAILYARRGPERRLPADLGALRPRTLRPGPLDRPDPGLEADVLRALERAPEAGILGFALASLQRSDGRVPEARATLERAWTASPRQAAVAELAGQLAAEAGELEEARTWFARAQRAAPRWPLPRRRLTELTP